MLNMRKMNIAAPRAGDKLMMALLEDTKGTVHERAQQLDHYYAQLVKVIEHRACRLLIHNPAMLTLSGTNYGPLTQSLHLVQQIAPYGPLTRSLHLVQQIAGGHGERESPKGVGAQRRNAAGRVGRCEIQQADVEEPIQPCGHMEKSGLFRSRT